MDPSAAGPETLGNFVLDRPIGKGGMGTVYLAHDPALQRPVAIKILPPQLAADPEYVARFEREATSLAKIRHPNLVHIYAVGCERARHYIAMEYVQGRNVGDILRRQGPLGVGPAARILGQVLSALDKVHGAGIVHRDLKPGNIMIDEDGRAILMDFGLAKPAADRSVTTGHALIGTPEYMAPELAEGGEATPRSDLYALGVVLFEMLTGQVPFRGRSAVATLRQHVETPPPALRKLAPGTPPALEAIAQKALAKDPARRYPSARAFAADLLAVSDAPELRALAANAGAPTSPTLPMDGAVTPTPATQPGPARRRRRLLGAAGAGACVLLGALALLLLPGQGDEPRPAGPAAESAEPRGSDHTKNGGSDPGPPGAGRPVYRFVLRRQRLPMRGRLLRIEGEEGNVVVETRHGEVSVPYGEVFRLERD
ncbi:MAG: protein kinase domain-containing protein [Candidatus Brocadiia bacterium]